MLSFLGGRILWPPKEEINGAYVDLHKYRKFHVHLWVPIVSFTNVKLIDVVFKENALVSRRLETVSKFKKKTSLIYRLIALLESFDLFIP